MSKLLAGDHLSDNNNEFSNTAERANAQHAPQFPCCPDSVINPNYLKSVDTGISLKGVNGLSVVHNIF